MDRIHPRAHFSHSGKWQNISSLSLPQMSATLPSTHPIPSWALPRKPSFIEKPALASLPEFLRLLQSALLPAATNTIGTLYAPLFPLNSALRVFELNVICRFMHEHHGTLFSFLRSAPHLALLNHFFPYKFASSLFTVFSASLMNALIGMNTSMDLCALPPAPAATVKTGSILL